MAGLIDDIFAQTKTKAAAGPSASTKKAKDRTPKHASSSSSSASESTKKKGKRKLDSIDDDGGDLKEPVHAGADKANKKKRVAKPKSNGGGGGEPETVLDPSLPSHSTSSASILPSSASGGTKRGAQGRLYTAKDEDDIAFADSRGSTRKRTEEGFPIYTEAELKIGLGGDTPLCPFDCDCCF